MKVLQWNMKGYTNIFFELQLLIKDLNPDNICIQETHFSYKNNKAFQPKEYTGYFENLPLNKSAKQGTAVLIRKQIPHKLMPISSTIATIGIGVTCEFTITIINAYIPPHQNVSTIDLCSITHNLASPVLLVGDFNTWSPSERGKIIEDYIVCEDLIVLNDGSATHFSMHRSLTHIDISVCSSSVAPRLSWTISDNH